MKTILWANPYKRTFLFLKAWYPLNFWLMSRKLSLLARFAHVYKTAYIFLRFCKENCLHLRFTHVMRTACILPSLACQENWLHFSIVVKLTQSAKRTSLSPAPIQKPNKLLSKQESLASAPQVQGLFVRHNAESRKHCTVYTDEQRRKPRNTWLVCTIHIILCSRSAMWQ